MDNPWITDVGDLDGLVRLSVEFAIDGDFRYGGDAASIGQGLVQTILRTHWDGPIHEFERRAGGKTRESAPTSRSVICAPNWDR